MSTNPAKRLKRQDATVASPSNNKVPLSPRSIVTWNCNGFVTRCKSSVPKLNELLERTNHPDMICIQEARLKAHSSNCRGQPMASEFKGAVEEALNTVFQDYTPYWSLADTRYAGTLTLLKHKFHNAPVAYSVDSAIDLLLQHYQLTRDEVGLAKTCSKLSESTNSGNNTAPPKPAQQKSISSFFQAKKPTVSKPATSKRPLSSSSSQQQHHEEGRFQFFFFEDMDIVQTYSPNHGNNMEKWERRKEWDLQVLEFVRQRQAILKKNKNRPLLWCGDLNCAHQYMDGTNWERKPDGSIYEWWTDESVCIIDKKNSTKNKPPQFVGMPSFTPAERTRFSTWLEAGQFVDVWRHLNPEPSQLWNAPNWTWRGKGGRYENKGQRLDYFLLSAPANEISKRVESCRIMGTGFQKGLFCDSDHCVSLLVLKEDHGETD